MKTPRVKRELCTGCGTCSALCPGVFVLGADQLASVTDPNGASAEEIQMAADSCPTAAITLDR
ncbi:MAG: ferredoxin [Patescibacteria group bacterium]